MKLRNYVLSSLLSGALFMSNAVMAQNMPKPPADPPKNWHTLDLKTDGYYGISLKQAYNFLKGKKSKTVLVTTVDSGIDTAQKDLSSILWVNPKEIPNNGKDDDGDGYIDDVHGWDFLGGKNRKVDINETVEEVREYNRLKGIYLAISQAPAGKEKEFAYWQKVKTTYDSTMSKTNRELKDVSYEVNVLTITNGFIKRELKLKSDQTFNLADLAKIHTVNDTVTQSKAVWESVLGQIGGNTDNSKVLKDIGEYLAKLNANVTPDLDARTRIVGDDPNVKDGKPYGNNVLKNSDASHGTGVAGLIGAVRNNGYGIDGVADNVRIMSIKAVPNGDEYDKDIANAIHFAVDHGAQIINMSFGKKISPHKEWVDEAFKYAASKDVLLVKASGNDGQDIDVDPEYPTGIYLDGTPVDNIIYVGASGPKPDTTLAASFSNYGKIGVDVFAPGAKVTSIDTDAEFNTADGTSFSAPIVTGIAALCLEYYPNLSSKQLKEIILECATPVKGVMVSKPGGHTRVDFATLSKTGGIVNAYRALEIASKMKGERK